MQKTIDLLGHKAKDKVTGFEGIITSVSFDLYGCIQACVAKPIKNPNDKLTESYWLDTNRLTITSKKPVMSCIHHNVDKGPAELPRKA